MYVSFQAQYTYIYAVKNVSVASAIEAAMLDAGMIILSALGIGLALAGKASKAERFLIMVCAGLSAFMNYAAADTASWRSVVAYVAAPVFLAVIVDRVISVIRRHVLPLDAESAWVPLGRATIAAARLAALVLLYLLRFVLAPPSTGAGLRQVVLNAAPLPAAPGPRGAPGRRRGPGDRPAAGDRAGRTGRRYQEGAPGLVVPAGPGLREARGHRRARQEARAEGRPGRGHRAGLSRRFPVRA